MRWDFYIVRAGEDYGIPCPVLSSRVTLFLPEAKTEALSVGPDGAWLCLPGIGSRGNLWIQGGRMVAEGLKTSCASSSCEGRTTSIPLKASRGSDVLLRCSFPMPLPREFRCVVSRDAASRADQEARETIEREFSTRLSKCGEGERSLSYLSSGNESFQVLKSEFCRTESRVDEFLENARCGEKIRNPAALRVKETICLPERNVWAARVEPASGENLMNLLGRTGPLSALSAANLFRGLAGIFAAFEEDGLLPREFEPQKFFCGDSGLKTSAMNLASQPREKKASWMRDAGRLFYYAATGLSLFGESSRKNRRSSISFTELTISLLYPEGLEPEDLLLPLLWERSDPRRRLSQDALDLLQKEQPRIAGVESSEILARLREAVSSGQDPWDTKTSDSVNEFWMREVLRDLKSLVCDYETSRSLPALHDMRSLLELQSLWERLLNQVKSVRRKALW